MAKNRHGGGDMRKLVIFIAATTGASVIAGTAYVYATDTCLTESCNSKKREEINKKISLEWENISKNIEKKKSLTAMVRNEFVPLIESHYYSINNVIKSSIDKNTKECVEYFDQGMIGYGQECFDSKRKETSNMESKISKNEILKKNLINDIVFIMGEADSLSQKLFLLTPSTSPEDERIFKRLNDEFNENFQRVISSIGKNSVVSANKIDDKNKIFSSINNSIRESLEKINNTRSL